MPLTKFLLGALALSIVMFTGCFNGDDLDLFDEIDEALTRLTEAEEAKPDYQHALQKSAELRTEMSVLLRDRKTLSTPIDNDEVLDWQAVHPIFEKHCFRCHGDVTPAFEAYEVLRQRAQKRVDMRVFPFVGHPSSHIYEAILEMIERDEHGLPPMPFDARNALSNIEIQQIQRWILQGANGYTDPEINRQVEAEEKCRTWPMHCWIK